MSVAMENRYPQPDAQLQQSTSRPETRPRSKSTLSFKSGKSGTSHSRKESHDEKQHLHAHTKADPNAAMMESQPIAAALEKPTLQSLRSFAHTDIRGNPIEEPDISNPTRSKWERPLDTIRSFEAAIDNEYRRRAQTMRADTNTEIMSNYGGASRRSSYYGGHEQNRYSGYYGNRQAARDSWMDNAQGMGGPVGGPPRGRYNRMQQDPQYNRYSNGHNVYPNQGYHQSRDTVNTNGSNGSHSDPYGTDPSSDNSSVERAAPPVRQPDMGEQYGFTGFGGGPIMEEGGQRNSYFAQQPQQQSNGNGYGSPPAPPQKNGPPTPPVHGQPIKLTKSNASNGLAHANGASQDRPSPEKRRSWFKRRFSKD